MSFWELSDGSKPTGNEDDANVNTSMIVPNNTLAKAKIIKFKNEEMPSGDKVLIISWQLHDTKFKGLYVNQKIKVFDNNPSARDRALNILVRLYKIANITPSHDANKWYNIAIVYYYSNTSFDVYADDVYKGTCDVTTLTDVDTISFEHSYPFGSLYIDNLTIDDGVVTNTAPVINSISPSTRIELKSGESQSYSADVTDDEDDASYSWDLGGIEVSTSETYTANWDDIAAGIYTLTLTVDDGTYDDTESTTLEIRARGGSPSGTGAVVVTVEDEAVVDEDAGKIQPEQQSGFTRVINNIADYFVGLWERIFG